MARDSDRWVTPGVVMVAMALGTVIVLAIVVVTAYLTARGLDPAPVVDLVGTLVAAVGVVINLGVSLAGRRGVAKVERNTAPLAPGGVPVVVAQEDDHTRLWGDGPRHGLPPVPPSTDR